MSNEQIALELTKMYITLHSKNLTIRDMVDLYFEFLFTVNGKVCEQV